MVVAHESISPFPCRHGLPCLDYSCYEGGFERGEALARGIMLQRWSLADKWSQVSFPLCIYLRLKLRFTTGCLPLDTYTVVLLKIVLLLSLFSPQYEWLDECWSHSLAICIGPFIYINTIYTSCRPVLKVTHGTILFCCKGLDRFDQGGLFETQG
jgi:hypothetical protein